MKTQMKMPLNNKGQALVEFVIILPIVLMIIFVVIDFSNIFYQKNHIENITNEIVDFKESGKSNDYIEEKLANDEVTISYKNDGDSLIIETKKQVKLITPFSNLFFESPYVIKTERAILYE